MKHLTLGYFAVKYLISTPCNLADVEINPRTNIISADAALVQLSAYLRYLIYYWLPTACMSRKSGANTNPLLL